MKTPVQELYERLWEADKDKFAWSAILIDVLEKEKEVMCQFADEFAIECINFHHEKTMPQEKFFDLTFNTK